MSTPKSKVYAPLIAVGIGITNTLTSSVRHHALIAILLGMLAVGLVFMRRTLGGSYIPIVSRSRTPCCRGCAGKVRRRSVPSSRLIPTGAAVSSSMHGAACGS